MSERKKNIADFLARHLVTLVGMNVRYDKEHKRHDMETVHGSSFVMIYRERWFLLTAGHIITALNEALDKTDSTLHVALIDSVHYNAIYKHSLWLPFEVLPRASVGNDDDIDYGFIVLSPNTCANLSANKIVPVVPANWENPPESFERYFLVGTPAEHVRIDTTWLPPRVISVRSAMIEVKPIDDPPEILRKPFPRFYGKIDISGIEPDEEPGIKDIGGMSGCPLLGVNFVNGQAKYWFYGIQSGWDGKTIIAACLFRPFAMHLKEALDKILDSRDNAAELAE